VAAFLLLFLAAGSIYLSTLPGVGDAEARVAAPAAPPSPR